MTRRAPLVRPLAALAAALCTPAVRADDARRLEWMARSDLVFDGIVLETDRSNIPWVKPSGGTSLVRVTRVREKPAAVRLKPEDVVTVQPLRGPGPAKGQRATFFTTGWVFGENIAVRLIGHEVLASATKEDALDARQLRRAVEDVALRERIQTAPVVVLGRVTAVTPAPDERGPETEHDPQWQDATVEVEAPVKGAQAGERLTVRFAASDDVRWFRAPKLRPEQRLVFLLSRDEKTRRLVVTDPKGVLEPEELPRVRALAAPPERQPPPR